MYDPEPAAGYHWESLVIPQEALDKLKKICELLCSTDTSSNRAQLWSGGALLCGPPGTRIRRIARTLAQQTERCLIAATAADLKTIYWGENGGLSRTCLSRLEVNGPPSFLLMGSTPARPPVVHNTRIPLPTKS